MPKKKPNPWDTPNPEESIFRKSAEELQRGGKATAALRHYRSARDLEEYRSKKGDIKKLDWDASFNRAVDDYVSFKNRSSEMEKFMSATTKKPIGQRLGQRKPLKPRLR